MRLRRSSGRPAVAPAPRTHVSVEDLNPLAELRRRQFYLALAQLLERYERWGEEPDERSPLPLTAYELGVWSQNGEDGVLAEILRRTGRGPSYFVEFGAAAGSEGNCAALAQVLGWDGLLIEADPRLYARLESTYRHQDSVVTLHAEVTPANVVSLFEQAGVPRDLDVLSIDVDGLDYWILEALGDYRPRVLVVEYNAHLPPRESLTVPSDTSGPWDGTDYFGASLGAFDALAGERGYRLVHTDLAGVNAFFVREELAAGFTDADTVPARPPNYLLTGLGHRPDPHGRTWVTPSVARAQAEDAAR